MTPDQLLHHCLAKPAAWLDHPFDPHWPVVKVGELGKIFCFVDQSSCGVKAGHGREVADEWLERYPGQASVMHHIGRWGWNELRLDGDIPDDEILDAVDGSYAIVVGRLPRKYRPAGWKG